MSNKPITLDEIRALLPSGKMYQLTAGSTLLFAYDRDHMSDADGKAIGEMMARMSLKVGVIGYSSGDGQPCFHIYEVKK